MIGLPLPAPAAAILEFIELGGPVVGYIFGACLLLWALILERYWYLRVTWPRRAGALVTAWGARTDRHSWQARKIREAAVSNAHLSLHALLPLISTLVTLCPLLGLLGTVTGMVGVFELIAVSGNEDARAMASGIYRATIPTMAGLVVALTGIYFSSRLRQLADRETSRLADRLIMAGPANPVVESLAR